MAFDPSPITAVAAYADNAELFVSWTTTAPPGTYYQAYADQRLAWHGTSTACTIPMPNDASTLHVGVVDASEAGTDLSASLASVGGPGDRVTLFWTGGTYLDPTGADDVAGFHVYQGTVAAGAVNYAKPVATVSAYPAGVIIDGWGRGRWGRGGWGRADSRYRWTSGPLSGGTWNFAVKAFNSAGIESTALTFSQAVVAPPNPPAPNAAGIRLTYTYDAGTRIPTLHWNASP